MLCPLAGGGEGVCSLSIDLRAVLNGEVSLEGEKFGWTFAPGGEVMQIESDYNREIYNKRRETGT
jgi:hypothetical protein